MKTLTAQTISFAQIQALRSEAASAQDYMQIAEYMRQVETAFGPRR